MLKTSGIIKLTLRENLRGQILWTSGLAGIVLLILTAALSGIALTHENRVIDVFGYFAADQLLLLIAIYSGASICQTDFSSRGLAELYIPAGLPRHILYFARLMAFATVLAALATAFFALKTLVLPHLAESPKGIDYSIQFTMMIYSWLKSLAALCLAGFLGCLVRPLFAVLGTLTLFSFGHLTSSFDSLLSAASAVRSAEALSESGRTFYFVFKIWNPNLLVVESLKGEWIQPTWIQFLQGLSWSASCICIFSALAIVRLQKIDLRQ
jgi:hypothetical protein